MTMYQSMVREGIAVGELIQADWMQIQLATLGANVFYFLSAPIWRLVPAEEPFAPEALAARRKALVEFLGQAVFPGSPAWAQNLPHASWPTRPCLEVKTDRLFVWEER